MFVGGMFPLQAPSSSALAPQPKRLLTPAISPSRQNAFLSLVTGNEYPGNAERTASPDAARSV